MEKIPKEHLVFLEFVMKIINEGSLGWWPLDKIAKEYNKQSIIKLSLDEVRDIAALYKNILFKTTANSDLQIFPLPEIKQGIEKYGSLSKYIKKNQSSSKHPTRYNIINKIIRNPIIQLIGTIVIIYSFLKILESIFQFDIPII